MPLTPEATRKFCIILVGESAFAAASIYGSTYFKLSSRLSQCNINIEKLLALYSSPEVEETLAKDASEAKELFDSLEDQDCKKDEFVKAKYKTLYELIVKKN